MKQYLLALLIAILLIFTLGGVLAQPIPLTTDQLLQMTDIAIISHDATQDARLNVVETHIAVSTTFPTIAVLTLTMSATPTRTAQGIPLTPTSEGATALSATPVTHIPTVATNTPTKTPTGAFTTPVATSPLPNASYTCRIIVTDDLTRRINPSPAAQSLGIVNDDTTLTIHPYDGSIPFNYPTLWYVRVADSSGGGWLLYARIDPAAGTLEPRVTEGYMTPVDPLCIPALLR